MKRKPSLLFRFSVLAFGVLFGANGGYGQVAVKSLSLTDALQKAQSHNAQLQAQAAQIDIARASLDETNAFFLPQVTLSSAALFTNAPLNAFGFKLQQKVVTQSDFNPSLLNSPGNVHNYLSQAEVRMPLVNLDGWKYRNAARKGVQAAELKRQYAGKAVAFNVKQVYYGLQLVARSEAVLTQAEATTRAALKYVSDNRAAGYAQKSDELALQVRLSELEGQKLQLANQKSTYMGQLRQLLGDTNGENWTLTDTLSTLQEAQSSTQTDLGGRQDLRAWTTGLAARKDALEAQQAKALPTLNAFGTYQYNDANLFGSQAGNYMAGVQLQWNVFTGGQRIAQIKKAQAELRGTQADFAAYKQQATEEYLQAQRQIELSKQELATARVAVIAAREALRIRTDRFAQGLERTPDVLAAETTRSQQELRVAQANYALYIAYARLEWLSPDTTTR